MTVYFACRPSAPQLVKIGHSDDVEHRMLELMSAYEDGIELLAQCEGGLGTEAGFHKIFSHVRAEGEWFAKTSLLADLIDALSGNVKGRRTFQRTKASGAGSRSEEDQIIASNLLMKVVALLAPERPVGIQQETAFTALHAVNPMWSRRRVRAVWEHTARRIELYEIRDLIDLLPVGNRRADWAEALAPELKED